MGEGSLWPGFPSAPSRLWDCALAGSSVMSPEGLSIPRERVHPPGKHRPLPPRVAGGVGLEAREDRPRDLSWAHSRKVPRVPQDDTGGSGLRDPGSRPQG